MALTSSMEDYLEAVLILHQKRGSVRGVDIAVHLGVTKPSVSRAVKELSKSEYIVKNTDGTLSLTDSGLQIATQIYEKHQFFTRQLIEAGVPQDIAAQDACRLEHVISETSFQKLKEAAFSGSREDSLDRLMEENARQFAAAAESVEDVVIRKLAVDKLHTALMQLTKEERDFICALFFDEKTESEVAKGLGVSQQAVHKRKSRILKKLKNFFE